MPRLHPRLAPLFRPLSVNFEFCLAATAFFLWCLAGSYQVQIGISAERFRLVVESPHWQPRWPVLPWLLGAGGLGLVYARHRWGSLQPIQTLRLGRHLRQLTLLTGALLLLRPCILWSALTVLFPYLTLLWSPHLTWALGAAFLLFPQAGILPSFSTRAMALVLLPLSAAGFALWTLYFCQMTMLHGDEAHYLRVTQSLLHDGDMDLSNNLGAGQFKEFHIIDFAPHQAPGSPPGKIHSVHPIGLSAMLLPAYSIGLQLWSNPRLASSLVIALQSAGVVTLLFVWLVRLGFGRWQALACALIGATTCPLFIYVTQLYPEIPALLVTLIALVLLVHWQQPQPEYRSLGRQEPLVLAGLVALLICLLFLHPRYLLLALFLGAGVFLQVRHSAQPWALGRLVGAVTGVGILALLAYNYAYSNDLFGAFIPGNAWEEDALQGSTWLLSLPGHWLHATAGLLNSSPVFLASVLGLVFLALKRDPRLWGALAFYLATAGVNGLHPDWTFGFCPPARFLLTALPLLLWGLALFLQEHGGRLPALFALLFALALAYDGVLTVASFPEQAFGGNHLSVRTLNEFYPLGVHFFTESTGDTPWAQLCFWALTTGALAVGFLPQVESRWRCGGLLVAGLLPFVWGQTGALTDRLAAETSPYLIHLSSSGEIPTEVQYFSSPVQKAYQTNTGHALESGGYGAEAPKDAAGVLKSLYGPLIQPGITTYTLGGVHAEHAPGQVAGHFTVAQRQILPALADWGVFRSQPIPKAGTQEPAVKLSFHTTHTSLAYAYVEFSGAGALAFKEVQNRFVPLRLGARLSEVGRFEGEKADGNRSALGFQCEKLERGSYLARFNVKGSALGTLFERKPSPVYMAVYAAQNSPAGGPSLESQATRWLSGYIPFQDQTTRPEFIRPLVESIQAPWWTAVPLVGASAFELEFGLNHPQEIWLLYDYPGDAGLELGDLALYRVELSSAALDD